MTFLCCCSIVNRVSISLVPLSVNSAAREQQRRSTLPQGLAIATSSPFFSSSIISHKERQHGAAPVCETAIAFKNAFPSQDVIRIMKRLARSCCCDVLMKLAFDLKISQEAQTRPRPMLGIQAVCCVPPCCTAVGGGRGGIDVIGTAESVRGEIAEKKWLTIKSPFSHGLLGHFLPDSL